MAVCVTWFFFSSQKSSTTKMNPQNVWVQKTAAHFCHRSCPFNLNFIYWWSIQYLPTQHLRLQKSTKYIHPPYHIRVMRSARRATLNALREAFFHVRFKKKKDVFEVLLGSQLVPNRNNNSPCRTESRCSRCFHYSVSLRSNGPILIYSFG